MPPPRAGPAAFASPTGAEVRVRKSFDESYEEIRKYTVPFFKFQNNKLVNVLSTFDDIIYK
jgi:hypothetical protein